MISVHLSIPLFSFMQLKDKCASYSFTTKELTHSMCQVSLVVKYLSVQSDPHICFKHSGEFVKDVAFHRSHDNQPDNSIPIADRIANALINMCICAC